jgi:hypothetical protein
MIILIIFFEELLVFSQRIIVIGYIFRGARNIESYNQALVIGLGLGPLFPMALFPMELSPMALFPMELFPMALFPMALFPMALSPAALSPAALFPVALSPAALFPAALSPGTLLFLALPVSRNTAVHRNAIYLL